MIDDDIRIKRIIRTGKAPFNLGRLYRRMILVRNAITIALTIPARYRDGARRIKTIIGGKLQRDGFSRYRTAR